MEQVHTSPRTVTSVLPGSEQGCSKKPCNPRWPPAAQRGLKRQLAAAERVRKALPAVPSQRFPALTLAPSLRRLIRPLHFSDGHTSHLLCPSRSSIRTEWTSQVSSNAVSVG